MPPKWLTRTVNSPVAAGSALYPLTQEQVDAVLQKPLPKSDGDRANRIAVDALLANNWVGAASDASDYGILGWTLFGFGFVILGTTAISLTWSKAVNAAPR